MIFGFFKPIFRRCLGILMNFGFFGANFCALFFYSNDFWVFISFRWFGGHFLTFEGVPQLNWGGYPNWIRRFEGGVPLIGLGGVPLIGLASWGGVPQLDWGGYP